MADDEQNCEIFHTPEYDALCSWAPSSRCDSSCCDSVSKRKSLENQVRASLVKSRSDDDSLEFADAITLLTFEGVGEIEYT